MTTVPMGFDESSAGVSGGVQFAVSENWHAGVALGYERSNLDIGKDADADGDIFHIGGSLRYQQGNLQLVSAVTGGFANYDTTRVINIPGVASTAKADADLSYVAGRLRAAYVLGSTSFYVKPLVDLDVVGTNRDSIHENGAGSVDLLVRGETDTMFAVTPAIEIGSELAGRSGTLYRPFAKVGVAFLNNNELSATALFEGTPPGVAPFTVTSDVDDVLAVVGIGLDVLNVSGFELRVSYEGRLGEDTEQHGASLKLRKLF